MRAATIAMGSELVSDDPLGYRHAAVHALALFAATRAARQQALGPRVEADRRVLHHVTCLCVCVKRR